MEEVKDNRLEEKAEAEQEESQAGAEFIVRKEMPLSYVIQMRPESIRTFMMTGMGCIACPASLMETVEQAAYVHGLDPDWLVGRLNEDLKKADQEKAEERN